MKADLHIHTVYSDGAHTPDEVARMAREAGAALFSMTDHDSLEGLAEKRAAARAHGLKYVSGWEVSAYEGDKKVHILGYGCAENAAYAAFLRARCEGAVVRARDMIEKANALLHLNVTLEDAEREHVKKSAPLHTMHVVAAFARRLGKKKGETYLAYFAEGRPAYSGLCRPAPQDAVEAIHACGGIASLAHPGRIALPEEALFRLADALVAGGLDGIECFHSQHTAGDTARFAAYARERGLLITGGSDFHVAGRGRTIGLPEFVPSGRLLDVFARLGEGE